ncbi:unnamed protein product [Cuscuta europaea]|uniref:TF-B3 domain-containing protein n=1 Tax=Cuscuta europaea TaxID=41803 RepID=A0A9P0Z408_CUSEU|nr:unnamed protein product [Cuscuta europaea]
MRFYFNFFPTSDEKEKGAVGDDITIAAAEVAARAVPVYFDFFPTSDEKEKAAVGDDITIAAPEVAAEAVPVESVSTELCLSLHAPRPSPTKLIDSLGSLLPEDEGGNLTLGLSQPGSCTSAPTTWKRKTSSSCSEATPESKRSRTKASPRRESRDEKVHQSPSPRAGLEEGGGDGLWVKKMLSASDVNSSSRLLLPKTEIMDRYVLPSLDEEKKRSCHSGMGLRVKVTDMDRNEKYELTLLRWKSKSYVLTNNWSGNFVRRRLLKEGDSIELSWNTQNLEFLFRKSTNTDDKVPPST